MDIQELRTKLEKELGAKLISARILLGRMRVIEERSRRTFAYTDDTYTPFYYHLGKHIHPKSLLKIGFRLGLLSGCFLKSCRSVETFLGFQEKEDEYFSPRMGVANIKDAYPNPRAVDVHVGDFMDVDFTKALQATKWDMVMFNEETTHDKMRLHMDMVWPHVEEGGLIVVEYVNFHQPTGDVFRDFCKVQGREPTVVNTRYGVGLIER